MGFEYHQAFGTQEQKLEINPFWNISCRQFLQVFGSEVCRDFVPKALPQMNFNGLTMWVRLFEKFYQDHPNNPIVVSDVRFDDECETIRKLGGVVIKIVRSSAEEKGDGSNLQHLQHKSELQELKYDHVIYNDGSLDDLYKKIDSVITSIINTVEK